jgi:hypothetical protein
MSQEYVEWRDWQLQVGVQIGERLMEWTRLRSTLQTGRSKMQTPDKSAHRLPAGRSRRRRIWLRFAPRRLFLRPAGLTETGGLGAPQSDVVTARRTTVAKISRDPESVDAQ